MPVLLLLAGGLAGCQQEKESVRLPLWTGDPAALRHSHELGQGGRPIVNMLADGCVQIDGDLCRTAAETREALMAWFRRPDLPGGVAERFVLLRIDERADQRHFGSLLRVLRELKITRVALSFRTDATRPVFEGVLVLRVE